MPGSAGQSDERLIVVCGCMFAGKTSRLMELLAIASTLGRHVLACKHALDRRYDPQYLATHDGRRQPAVAVADAAEIEQRAAEGYEVVGIDEGHFFGRELAEVCARLVAADCRVIVAGLDHDAWGQPFPPFPQLSEAADEIEILYASCSVCGRPGRYSQRMVPVRDDDMVGGPGEYEPRCREHFQPLPGPAPVYA